VQKPTMDNQQFSQESSNAQNRSYIDNLKNRRQRRYIDIGTNRLSELLGLTISRLVPNNNDTFYNSYSLEDSLLQACRFALSNDYNKNYVIDKHVTYFINDKKKYPTEFFKLYLNYFPRAESLDIDLLEINF
jgi:hypothetical protein